MFVSRYFDGYWTYKYDRNRLWILDQTQDSYWTKNASLKDYRVKNYVASNDDDDKIMETSLIQNDIDLIQGFKMQCMNYVDIPMMSHLLSLKPYHISHSLSSQIILSLSRCLDIRRQIALNRKCKNTLKDSHKRRSLSDKNAISQSELNDISSIVEIGIKSNFAMLNAVSSTKHSNKRITHKILSVLTNLLSHLGPLSLKNNPFPSLQSLLINLCSDPNKYEIDIQFPLQSLLALTLCQSTLPTTINTVNAMFDAVLQSKDSDELKMKITPPFFDLISKSFGITLEAPNKELITDSFNVSLSVPKPFTAILDLNREHIDNLQKQTAILKDTNEEKKENEPVEDEKDDEKEGANKQKEKKRLEAKRKAIEKRLTEFVAKPTGAAITSYKSYLIYLNDKGLHKIGTGYHGTQQAHVYASLNELCLADDNIAWMTIWHNGKEDESWILIRFRYAPQKTADTDRLSGSIYVIHADTFLILGEIHQNGKGSIETEDNSKYASLGPITTAIGPIFVDQTANRLCAFQFSETVDDVCTLKVQQFELPTLKYLDKDLEIYGPSKKKKQKGSMKQQQSEDATAFGWGQNGSGGLGINETSSKYTPTPLKFLPKIRMEQCFAGNETSFFVTSSGSVYANGRNGSGQLALGANNVSNQMKPQLIKPLSAHRIIKISGSRHGNHTVFLTDKGKVFCAGNNGNGQVKTANDGSVSDPYCINDKDEELMKITKKKGKKWLFFIDIAAATNRSAAVTKNGELYGWGNNNRRSMGLESESSFRHPMLEKRFAEKLKLKIVRIDMGHSFSLCLDSKGDCYAVGDASYGQLGLGDNTSKTEWTKVPFAHKWKEITCGYYHAMAIAKMKDGSTPLYVWGNNQNGQLGLGNRERQNTPTAVLSLNKSDKIRFIQGGGFCSACLMMNGDVYIWGSNSYGEQGQGDTTTRQQPTKVTTEGFDEHKIKVLAVGYYHCLAIPENRDSPIKRNTLHDMRWYNAPQKIGCLMRDKTGNSGHQIRIYNKDESKIFTAKQVEYDVKEEMEPIDITYNAYNHSIYAVYAPPNGDSDQLLIRKWTNGSHLELSKDRLIWESEYFLTHADYLLDLKDSEQDGSLLLSITVNFIACIDLMIKSKLIDPYLDDEEQIEEWKYLYDREGKRSLTLFARCLCIGGDEKVFESLIKSVIVSWNVLKNVWISKKSNEYKVEDKLFRARIYLLIALFRILSFNVKMFSIKAMDETKSSKNMKDLGDALFHLLSDVTNTVDACMDTKKGNKIEEQALNTITNIAQQTFTYAFNVFYSSWNNRAQFLLTLFEDINAKKLSDGGFKTIGVENILKSSELSNLYAVTKKVDKLYEYIKDKKDDKEDKKEESDADDDEKETEITPRHNVMDALLSFVIAPDLRALHGLKQDPQPHVEEIRQLVFKLITSIQVDINNKVAFEILKSEAKSGNPSKIFVLSLKIVSESNQLLSQIMKHKDADHVINNSKLLRYLLPVAIQSFQPFIKRLRPAKHPKIFEALHELNDKLNQLNKDRDITILQENDEDDIMVIESDHPYIATKSNRYVAHFADTVDAVMINFDIRCKFRSQDDQLVIGFPENPNYFHGDFMYDVPGTLMVPSNKIYVTFIAYGSAAQRTEKAPIDALQKRWGFRLFCKPQKLAHPTHYLYSQQMTLCDMLALVASQMQSDRIGIESKQSLKFPKPAALYSSTLLKNGLHETKEDVLNESDSKEDIQVYNLFERILADNEDDTLMTKVRSQFSTASASHSVVIDDDLKVRKDIFGGIPSEVKVKVRNTHNEALTTLQEDTCSIKAQLFKKIARKPREEERDWMKSVSWGQYEHKTIMDFKSTQFAICFDGKDTVYIIGGYKEGNVDSKDCYSYALKEDKYTKIQSLDFAVKCHNVQMLNDGRILSMGGNTAHCAIYDASTNKWDYTLNTDENKKNFGSGSRFVIIENKNGEEIAHCIGGSKYIEDDDDEKKGDDNNDGGDKHWTFNINNNEWILMEKRCPTKVKYHGLLKDAFNRIYCFGGKPNGKQMHCFDIETNEWLRCPDIPVEVCSFGTCFDGDTRYILVCGGSDSVQPHAGAKRNDFYLYDTVEGEWKKSDHNLPYGVKDSACLVIGKRCHLFGGSNGSPLNKHITGTSQMESKQEDSVASFQHKLANEDWIQLVQKETKFKVIYDKDNNGVATIQWTPFIHGTYLMDVWIDGQPIKNSPYSIVVQPLCDLCLPQNNNQDKELVADITKKWIKDTEDSNVFEKPHNTLFVYNESDLYTCAFVEYVASVTYRWQANIVEMPDNYNAALSTGVYGSYALQEVETTTVSQVEEAEKGEYEVKMAKHYKASYNSGVYGAYALKEVPLRYCPAYNSGVYGIYMMAASYDDGLDIDTDDEEEEDTFNALFKEVEKHSTYRKNADQFGHEDNLDAIVMFGGVVPKKWMIDGARVCLECGPRAIDVDTKEDEKEDQALDISQVPFSTASAYKAIQCVFLAFIKHLECGPIFYKWTENETIDSEMIGFMRNIWQYSSSIACHILREREDFCPEKTKIKTKEMMEYKKKDIKELLEEFKKKRNEIRKAKKEENKPEKKQENEQEKKEENEQQEKKDENEQQQKKEENEQEKKEENEQEKKEKNEQEKKQEDEQEKEKKEIKMCTGVCKEFDKEAGFGIIVVDNEDNDEIKVDKSEIFGDYGTETLAIGEKVQFEMIETADGKKEAICCTGIDGIFVAGMKPNKEEKEDIGNFDGFTRGYNHLHKQCKVLISIRNSRTKSIASNTDLKENTICKSIDRILSLDESVELEQVYTLIRDRTKIALQKEKAYEMFCKLFASNDICQEFFVMILWYFYRSLSMFSFPTESKYRNKPDEIWDKKLDEHIKLHKYSLSNKCFKSHYLSELDGINVNIIKRLKVLFWNIVRSSITSAKNTYSKSIFLKNVITNICSMDWRKDDFDFFKQDVSESKQSIIQYLSSLSHVSMKVSDVPLFWKEDVFTKYIMDKEIEERKKRNVSEDDDGIIRKELPSLTWFADVDLDEKLFAADMENKCLRLNVRTQKDKDNNYTLYGNGSSPLIACGVEFEGEYKPYDDKGNNINLVIKGKQTKLKIEVASWSSGDPVKNGFNKSHIKIQNGNNKCTTNYGLHFALINLFNGGCAKYKHFDLHSAESNVKPLIEFAKDLPSNHLIVITSYYSSGKYWKKEIYEALKVYGWSWEKVQEYESFIFVANTDATVHYQEKKTRSSGPLQKQVQITLESTPNIQLNAGFVDEYKINAKWKFVDSANKEYDEWNNYVNKLKCKKENGCMDFTVSKELEDGWKWNENEDMKSMKTPFYSYLSIPTNAYEIDVSSNKSTSKNMNDKDLETYWQSAASAKSHWISFQFEEEACVSGIGFYFNYQKDSNYVPEVLKLLVGTQNKEDAYCVTTRRVQREFKGIYVFQLDSNEASKDQDNDKEAEEEENRVSINENGYIKCKYIKVEWLYEEQSKYARLRQIFLYSKKIDQLDEKIKSCFIQNDKLLSCSIWQSINLLSELEKEYDENWIKNVEMKQDNKENNKDNETMKSATKKQENDKEDMDGLGLFDDDEIDDEDYHDDEDEFSDDEDF